MVTKATLQSTKLKYVEEYDLIRCERNAKQATIRGLGTWSI